MTSVQVKIFFLVIFCFGTTLLLPAQQIDHLDAFLETQIARYRLPGAALTIVSGDSVIFSRGYGEGFPPQRPYYIGSLSKVFTATAVMQLVEKGQLKLGDQVSALLPEIEFKGPEAHTITVEHLLRRYCPPVRKRSFWLFLAIFLSAFIHLFRDLHLGNVNIILVLLLWGW